LNRFHSFLQVILFYKSQKDKPQNDKMQFTASLIAAFAGIVAAQAPSSMVVHVVSVSGNGNVFSPDRVTALPGEMVQFQFRAGNHSVVQSNFDNPCTPISQHTNQTGIFSNYADTSASGDMIPTFTVNVTNTTPMWFYCSQARHCQSGMSMVINEK
jgi:plastocyanin